MAKKVATKEQIAELYDPNYFYEHGSNPALKRLMEYLVENSQEGKMIDHRTFVVDKYKKAFYARNWDDFLQRDCKAYTFTRSFFVWIAATMGYMTAATWSLKLLPLGQHGITRFNQCQFYHLYGPIGVVGVLGFYFSAAYLWYKTTRFTADKFYHHVLLGERNWLYEQERQNPGYGEYFFNDTPIASEESLPDLAKFEAAKSPAKKSELD